MSGCRYRPMLARRWSTISVTAARLAAIGTCS